MKYLFGLCILTLVACIVYADIETCTEISDCSESIKNNCNEMSGSLKESGANQKLVVACKNGICMCNIEFIQSSRHTSHVQEKQEETEDVEVEDS